MSLDEVVSDAEEDFLARVSADVAAFVQGNERSRVLVFRAFNSRLRYLAHRCLAEKFDGIVTRSFGRDPDRILCVCYADKCVTTVRNDFAYSMVLQFLGLQVGRRQLSKPITYRHGNRSRRPDKNVYIPRRRLEMMSKQTDEIANTLQTLCLEPSRDVENIFCGDDLPGTHSSDENISSDVVEELQEMLGVVEVVLAKEDYSQFENVLRPTEYEHVLEIYDFPAEYRERDLIKLFSEYREASGFEIKWVSDTSVLGIFSSVEAAEKALQAGSGVCKLRSLSEGSKAALLKARRVQCGLIPALKRPQTNSSFARRMIGHALGQKISVASDKMKAERQQLDDAKEKKRALRRSNAEQTET
ncbi:unnamed protein product [Notodromas monacha]|uniref:R3H domain-containing protein n=1 Tax=Notodromas monacha TaxID=399045 RepID=A0A7R9BLE5_9CRUS|nr:unnamed protein product [Notodromas monacha]CAG0916287.1 unnamed protein product [Notodromas monacha]